jgi:hypothetical protein
MFLGLQRPNLQVSPQETEGPVRPVGDVGDVGGPAEVGRDGDAKVFSLIYCAEGVATELIGTVEWE